MTDFLVLFVSNVDRLREKKIEQRKEDGDVRRSSLPDERSLL